jgi:hypothetical protein
VSGQGRQARQAQAPLNGLHANALRVLPCRAPRQLMDSGMMGYLAVLKGGIAVRGFGCE